MKKTPIRFLNFFIVFLVGFILTACSTETKSNKKFSHDDFAREWTEAWNSHDIDRILTFYDDNVLFMDMPTVSNEWDVPLEGHHMLKESLVRTFEEMPDMNFEVVSSFGNGKHIVIEWILKGSKYKSYTGSYSVPAVSIIELKEDKILIEHDYYDAYLLLSQLGLIPNM